MERKKIVFVYYKLFRPRGIARVLTNLVNELAEEYEVTILLLMAEHGPFYKLDKRVKLEFVDSFSHLGFQKINKNLDKFVKKLPKRRNLQNYVYDYGVKQLFDNWLSENHVKFDTIITCMYKLSVQMTKNKKVASKTIAWEHTDHHLGGVLFNHLRRKNYKNLKSVVSINSYSGKFYKFLNSNSVLIPNIIGEPFESLNYSGKRENLISYVGRLDKDKNIIELLEIFKNAELGSDWKLQIIGDDWERNNLERFVIQNNLVNNILFHGSKNAEEIAKLLQQSKIFGFTSLKEAFALVLVEAMFCRNALLVYDCEFGPTDFLSDSNGFLISLYDKDRFVEKLKYLTSHTDELEKLNQSSFTEAQKWRKGNRLKQRQQIL